MGACLTRMHPGAGVHPGLAKVVADAQTATSVTAAHPRLQEEELTTVRVDFSLPG